MNFFFLHSTFCTLNTYGCIVIFVGRLIEIPVSVGAVQIKPLTRPTGGLYTAKLLYMTY